MVKNLEEAIELRGRFPSDVKIIREVRYYADVRGTWYTLEPDWTQRVLDEELDKHKEEGSAALVEWKGNLKQGAK